MEETVNFLNEFLSLVKNDVLDYFDKTHSYLKDLVSYKNVNLGKSILTETKENISDELEKMLKAIKTGLNTIGVPINIITKTQNDFLKELNQKEVVLQSYSSYLELYFREYINKILFNIILDYLLNNDIKKIETLKLFKVIPTSTLNKLNRFQEANDLKLITRDDLISYLDFSDLSLKIKKSNPNPKKNNLPTKNENNGKEKEASSEEDILTQLHKAKEDSIEKLKSPRKEVIKPSIAEIEKSSINGEPSKNRISMKMDFPLKKEDMTFLDNFGDLPPVHTEIVNKFSVNTSNLINSRIVNPDFLDLENLFYYISILKMLNIEFPFTHVEILDVLRKFVKDKVFSSSNRNIPDPINIFYGLAILSELDLIYKSNIINLTATEGFLTLELKKFIVEKLEMNYYSFLSLILLGKSEIFGVNRGNLLNQIKKLNILHVKGYNAILDIYNQLALVRMLGNALGLTEFKMIYLNELKKLVNSKGSINDSLTESARVLLILHMFDVKDQEHVLCARLLNFITTSTKFFSLENLDKDFNWRIDQLAYKVELRMLFWALLACSQYTPLDFLNI
ncbi:MAG: hypothetical protein ACXAEX_15215 [Promethearchaeota archaeon]|jgi:hypothetical protein